VLLVTGASGYLGSELMRRRPDAVGTYLTRPAPGFALDVRDVTAVLVAF
jgi:dTDP-4-dehydrorhamnose reductase